MSTQELAVVIGIVLVLILLPFLVAFILRRLIPMSLAAEEANAGAAGESPLQFNSLRDVWSAAMPHLTELRNRLTKALLGVALGTIVGAWLVYGSPLGKPLPDIMIDQFVPPNVNLQAIGTAETFVSYMGIALVVGIAIAVPIIIYQIVAFIAPGLLPHEKRMLFTAIPFIAELFLAGVAFAWFITIPAALQFLLNFGTDNRIITQPSLSSFLSTVSTLLLWNGLVFELPVVVYLLARIGLVSREGLSRTRRYAIVVIAIVAALITPTPDPYNMMILAVPMYLLYELGIQMTRFIPRRSAEQPTGGAGETA
jgi:sec-independent protein translocase protein TatC